MSGALPADLFSPINVEGVDVLHLTLAILSVAVFGISIAAYVRRRETRYFFLMIAFLFFCLDQTITLYQEMYYYGFLIVIPYIGVHLVHVLELLMLVSLIAALLPIRGMKS